MISRLYALYHRFGCAGKGVARFGRHEKNETRVRPRRFPTRVTVEVKLVLGTALRNMHMYLTHLL